MANKLIELMENCQYNLALDAFEKNHLYINDQIAWHFDQYNNKDLQPFNHLSTYVEMIKKGKSSDLRNSKNKYTGRLDDPLSKYILRVKSIFTKDYKGENILEIRPKFNPDTLSLTFIVYPEGDSPTVIKSTKRIDSYIIDSKTWFKKTKKVFVYDTFVNESILEVASQLNNAIMKAMKKYFVEEEETTNAN